MPNLDHVLWLGGGSGAGKSTVTKVLAERFGIDHYSTDTSFGIHGQRLTAAEAPLLERFRHMSLDERWVQQDPATMYATFPWFHGEGFDLIIEDLQRMPADRPVLVEGFRLIPHLVRPHMTNPNHAVWLVPTPDFRQRAFSQRRDAEAFWMQTSDPERALANLLERDCIFSDEIARDAAENDLGIAYVDGSQNVESMVMALASRFDLDR
jgi:2-phosphoglycerate kinase